MTLFNKNNLELKAMSIARITKKNTTNFFDEILTLAKK